MKVNLKNLEAAIISNRMMEIWGDGLFVTNDEEKAARANKRAEEVRANFVKMMESPKNKRKMGYESWAINKALGLSTRAQQNMQTKQSR